MGNHVSSTTTTTPGVATGDAKAIAAPPPLVDLTGSNTSTIAISHYVGSDVRTKVRSDWVTPATTTANSPIINDALAAPSAPPPLKKAVLDSPKASSQLPASAFKYTAPKNAPSNVSTDDNITTSTTKTADSIDPPTRTSVASKRSHHGHGGRGSVGSIASIGSIGSIGGIGSLGNSVAGTALPTPNQSMPPSPIQYARVSTNNALPYSSTAAASPDVLPPSMPSSKRNSTTAESYAALADAVRSSFQQAVPLAVATSTILSPGGPLSRRGTSGSSTPKSSIVTAPSSLSQPHGRISRPESGTRRNPLASTAAPPNAASAAASIAVGATATTTATAPTPLSPTSRPGLSAVRQPSHHPSRSPTSSPELTDADYARFLIAHSMLNMSDHGNSTDNGATRAAANNADDEDSIEDLLFDEPAPRRDGQQADAGTPSNAGAALAATNSTTTTTITASARHSASKTRPSQASSRVPSGSSVNAQRRRFGPQSSQMDSVDLRQVFSPSSNHPADFAASTNAAGAGVDSSHKSSAIPPTTKRQSLTIPSSAPAAALPSPSSAASTPSLAHGGTAAELIQCTPIQSLGLFIDPSLAERVNPLAFLDHPDALPSNATQLSEEELAQRQERVAKMRAQRMEAKSASMTRKRTVVASGSSSAAVSKTSNSGSDRAQRSSNADLGSDAPLRTRMSQRSIDSTTTHAGDDAPAVSPLSPLSPSPSTVLVDPASTTLGTVVDEAASAPAAAAASANADGRYEPTFEEVQIELRKLKLQRRRERKERKQRKLEEQKEQEEKERGMKAQQQQQQQQQDKLLHPAPQRSNRLHDFLRQRREEMQLDQALRGIAADPSAQEVHVDVYVPTSKVRLNPLPPLRAVSTAGAAPAVSTASALAGASASASVSSAALQMSLPSRGALPSPLAPLSTGKEVQEPAPAASPKGGAAVALGVDTSAAPAAHTAGATAPTTSLLSPIHARLATKSSSMDARSSTTSSPARRSLVNGNSLMPSIAALALGNSSAPATVAASVTSLHHATPQVVPQILPARRSLITSESAQLANSIEIAAATPSTTGAAQGVAPPLVTAIRSSITQQLRQSPLTQAALSTAAVDAESERAFNRSRRSSWAVATASAIDHALAPATSATGGSAGPPTLAIPSFEDAIVFGHMAATTPLAQQPQQQQPQQQQPPFRMVPQRSSHRGSHGSLQRSPQKSPQETPQQTPQQSPQQSPHHSPQQSPHHSPQCSAKFARISAARAAGAAPAAAPVDGATVSTPSREVARRSHTRKSRAFSLRRSRNDSAPSTRPPSPHTGRFESSTDDIPCITLQAALVANGVIDPADAADKGSTGGASTAAAGSGVTLNPARVAAIEDDQRRARRESRKRSSSTSASAQSQSPGAPFHDSAAMIVPPMYQLPASPLTATFASHLDAYSVASLTNPNRTMLTALWEHYNPAHEMALSVSALRQLGHDLVLRVCRYHAEMYVWDQRCQRPEWASAVAAAATSASAAAAVASAAAIDASHAQRRASKSSRSHAQQVAQAELIEYRAEVDDWIQRTKSSFLPGQRHAHDIDTLKAMIVTIKQVMDGNGDGCVRYREFCDRCGVLMSQLWTHHKDRPSVAGGRDEHGAGAAGGAASGVDLGPGKASMLGASGLIAIAQAAAKEHEAKRQKEKKQQEKKTLARTRSWSRWFACCTGGRG